MGQAPNSCLIFTVVRVCQSVANISFAAVEPPADGWTLQGVPSFKCNPLLFIYNDACVKVSSQLGIPHQVWVARFILKDPMPTVILGEKLFIPLSCQGPWILRTRPKRVTKFSFSSNQRNFGSLSIPGLVGFPPSRDGMPLRSLFSLKASVLAHVTRHSLTISRFIYRTNSGFNRRVHPVRTGPP